VVYDPSAVWTRANTVFANPQRSLPPLAFITSAVLMSFLINFLQDVNSCLKRRNGRLELHVLGRKTTPDKSAGKSCRKKAENVKRKTKNCGKTRDKNILNQNIG
jgi:hypothetical protein